MELWNHGEKEHVSWADHYPACKKCREVDVDAPGTLGRSCAQGAILLREFYAKKFPMPVVERGPKRASPEYIASITRYK